MVQALDAERGRSGFFLRGAGKGRGTLGAFHPLGILDVVAASGKGSLEYIRESEAPYSLAGIRTDPYKSAIALFISELLYRCMTDGDMDSDMFGFLQSEILALEGTGGSVANTGLALKILGNDVSLMGKIGAVVVFDNGRNRHDDDEYRIEGEGSATDV